MLLIDFLFFCFRFGLMNALLSLTPQQLREAADLQEEIQQLQARLEKLMGGTAQPPRDTPKGTISAAGRARIAAAARARWARQRAAKGQPGAMAKKPAKKKISAAGLRRISEAAKARWARARAEGKTSLK
jgi:hypothetical protein